MNIYNFETIPESYFESFELKNEKIVDEILSNVKRSRDKAVLKYSSIFDGIRPDPIRVPVNQIKDDCTVMPDEMKETYYHAIDSLTKFSIKQYAQFADFTLEVQPGVYASQKIQPIESVGIYVPSGNYPLASSLLMCAVPAKTAGVKHISVCSSPRYYNGKVHPYITAACHILGISTVYQVGGVQAIAAMAYGTESVNKVDKIVGPGNRYVAQAKKHLYGTVGIDMVAGPSEVCIIAEECSDPMMILSDLMAQAEHDLSAKAILISDSEKLIKDVYKMIESSLAAANCINPDQFTFIHVSTVAEACEAANKLAPEHLQIYNKRYEEILACCKNYGSLFIGEDSAEVFGDYIAGINHTLPTNQSSRFSSGLSVKDFVRLQTILKIDKDRAQKSIAYAKKFAKTEGLVWHQKAAELRENNC